jgi:adenylosuccinate synthase
MTQQLPTGLVNTEATLLLGPGAIIDPTILLTELENLDPVFNVCKRLLIHPRASIVLPVDKEREQKLVTIGSTRKGTASAACRKIMRIDEGYPRCAKECVGSSNSLLTTLGTFVTYVDIYDNLISNARLIQVESAQGIELSLSRGYSYPTCTGRDVTPEQIMNDVAVPMRFLNQTCLVIRTFPIRVGNEYSAQGVEIGNSGAVFPDQKELTWENLSELAGKRLIEYTTVTKKIRRVFTFSDKQLKHALWVSGPCNVFLNFMNYLDPNAKNLEKSNESAKAFYSHISELIKPSGAQIKWLGWGPDYQQVENLV